MFKKLVSILRGFFGKKQVEVSDYSSFSLKDQLIYSYEISPGKWVHVDPIVLYRKVMQLGPDISIDIQVASSPSKDAAKARQNLLKNLRKIFGVKEWDSETKEGMTEVKIMDLLDHFLLFCEEIKKNSRTSATLQMETWHSSPSTSAANPPTESTAASGSTEKEPSTVAPPPLPTELPLPSDFTTPESNTTKV